MRFGVLGPLLLAGDDGADLLPGSPTQRLVLACLLADPGAPVRREALIDAIWGDEAPRTADTSLRSHVSRLRAVVGDRLVRDSQSYRLELGPDDELDSAAFERLLEVGDVASLDAAIGLWRGDAFGDFVDVTPVVAAGRRLDQLRTVAIDRSLVARLAAGDTEATIADAEAHLVHHPLREAAWAVLVRGLHRSSRSAEALRAYQRAVATLAEAGLEPSTILREAEQEALGLDPTSPAPAPAPPAGPPARADGSDRPESSWAPAPSPSRPVAAGDRSARVLAAPDLIGRDLDVEQVEALLDAAPLVTLHGPGGVGKTALATVVAARWSDRVGAPAHIARLAQLTGRGATREAILDTLGVEVADDTIDEALARAGTLEALLVIDNCEHVIDEVAEAVEALTGPRARLAVLCTSRERLGVAGEHSWSLAPLATDDPDSPAVELFAERLRAHRSSAGDDAVDRDALQRLARQLDGLPLAIEMAAARAAVIGLAELERALADHLDILRSGQRHVDARHRTLRAVIEWSEGLLDDEGQRSVFRELAVFAGAVPTADIEAVLGRGPVLGELSDLVDRSLVVAETGPAATRFRLLQTVRQHIRSTEPALPSATVDRHTAHYLELARRADADLRTAAEPAAVAAIAGAMAELRALHHRTVDDDPETAMALSGALYLYAISRNVDEVQTWAEQVIERHEPRGPDGALTLTTAAYRANNQGRYDDARRLGEAAVELAAGDPVDRFAHEVLGDTALYNGDIESSLRHCWKLLRISEEIGDVYGIAAGYCGVALPLAYSGRRDEATALLADVDVRGWSPSAIGWFRYTIGEVLLDADPERAIDHLQAAVELADRVDARFLSGVARVSTSSLLGRHGRPETALRAFADIIEHWRTHRHSTHQITTLRNLAVLFSRLGAHGAAIGAVGATEAQGSQSFGDEAALLGEVVAAATAALGSEVADRRSASATAGLDAGVRAALDDIAALIDAGV